MRAIKFRAWDGKRMSDSFELDNKHTTFDDAKTYRTISSEVLGWEVMQYTGLKDKNGITEVYEGDIIDETGSIVGNIYEMDKRETDFVIQGFGTKAWCKTYSRAILLGCKDAE